MSFQSMGDHQDLAPDPPDVLPPGKLGLAGPRPDKVENASTYPCSLGSMHGFTFGLFVSFFAQPCPGRFFFR